MFVYWHFHVGLDVDSNSLQKIKHRLYRLYMIINKMHSSIVLGTGH